MKRILALFLLTIAGLASAGSLNTDSAYAAGFNDLPETEKADIIKQIADRKAAGTNAAKVAEQTTPQKVNDWLDIGSRIGQGMAGAAREMGVAVNEFAKSPVGMWTIALITWKFMGGVLMHAFGALMIWLIGFSFIWWINRRRTGIVIQYDAEKADWLGRSRTVSVQKTKLDDDSYVSMIVCGFIVLIAGLVTMFTY